MRALLISTALALSLAGCAKAPEAPKDDAAPVIERTVEALRLYVMDCGRIDVSNMGVFDRGGAYEGQSRAMVDSCYLVRHPQGDLMWDAGLPDAINAAPDGVVSDVFLLKVPKTLKGQLERIGAPPEAIEFFSVSHSHFDHVGNANLFKDATFIVHEKERDFMFRP
jgi:N-acyl homoserine lactone hydrolase